MLGPYTGHIKLTQAFYKLRLPRDTEILDVSAHTTNPGLVGMELSHNGFVNVDGLDHSLAALSAIRRQGPIYRNYILGRVGDLGSIPVKDGEFSCFSKLNFFELELKVLSHPLSKELFTQMLDQSLQIATT